MAPTITESKVQRIFLHPKVKCPCNATSVWSSMKNTYLKEQNANIYFSVASLRKIYVSQSASSISKASFWNAMENKQQQQ